MNPDTIDPELSNNFELVKSLKDLESAWFLCKQHLADKDHLNDLVAFSKIIVGVGSRYPVFKMQI